MFGPSSIRRVILTLLLPMASAVFISACSETDKAQDIVTVYSERKEHLIKPLFDEYTAQTGVEVRYITAAAGPLISRLENEAASTPADLFITVDAGNIWQAAERGLLKPVSSDILEKNIPSHLQATDNTWFSLSLRARTILYSTERVRPEELSTYEALAEAQWKGRLCLRTSKKVYNQSLVATMIKTQGAEKTETIVQGWVANLATDPYSNDTSAMEAVLAGQCDITVVNTYYFGRLQAKDPDIKLAVFWPNQSDRGVHVNISGAGLTKHGPNSKGAQALLEWLSKPQAQYTFAELNQEYPANPKVEPTPLVKAWGTFKQDLVNVESAGGLQAEAIKLMDRAAYR